MDIVCVRISDKYGPEYEEYLESTLGPVLPIVLVMASLRRNHSHSSSEQKLCLLLQVAALRLDLTKLPLVDYTILYDTILYTMYSTLYIRLYSLTFRSSRLSARSLRSCPFLRSLRTCRCTEHAKS